MPKSTFLEFMRVRTEASFEDNQTTPATSKKEWNVLGGGATGWMDLPVVKDNPGLQPKSTMIYPMIKSGVRAMNTAMPVAGAFTSELGALDLYMYLELMDRIFYSVFGAVARTPTAGTAAQTATAFASLATLSAQPTGTEQLRFTVASSTAATSAIINILVGGVVQESINIGTSGASVDGVYWSKGGYGPTVTFTVSGSVTDGTVAVDGFKYSTNVFTQGATNPTLQFEQAGRPEAGSGNSEFFSGITIPTLTLSYDRPAQDSLFMANATIHGLPPITATAGAFANDFAAYYQPLAGWTAAVTLDGVAYAEVASASITIQPNNALTSTSSGHQKPNGQVTGEFEVFGNLSILPDSDARWLKYKNATAEALVLDFLSPYMVNGSDAFRFKLDLSRNTYADYGRTRNGQALGADLQFRGIYNTTDSGSVKATTRCRMPL
ncbi:MAG: hypothetical protein BroJett011_04010 [Chloroflexota bacterium]|nr:MAG: hypothetical protein BroJett011_04010 [Chloroflexota bacterium]